MGSYHPVSEEIRKYEVFHLERLNFVIVQLKIQNFSRLRRLSAPQGQHFYHNINFCNNSYKFRQKPYFSRAPSARGYLVDLICSKQLNFKL